MAMNGKETEHVRMSGEDRAGPWPKTAAMENGNGLSRRFMPISRNHQRHTAWGIKVLLIDDDVRDLEYLFWILEAQGHEVISCTNYHLGAQLVGSGLYDFIIVSQGGRGFEGKVVIERARKLERRPPVLVVTRIVDMKC